MIIFILSTLIQRAQVIYNEWLNSNSKQKYWAFKIIMIISNYT